jgi:hypothetical protein
MEQVVAMFHRDARSREIAEVINDLVKLGQVKAEPASLWPTSHISRES